MGEKNLRRWLVLSALAICLILRDGWRSIGNDPKEPATPAPGPRSKARRLLIGVLPLLAVTVVACSITPIVGDADSAKGGLAVIFACISLLFALVGFYYATGAGSPEAQAAYGLCGVALATFTALFTLIPELPDNRSRIVLPTVYLLALVGASALGSRKAG